MKLKVVHLFTSDGGGAGIAAVRLHQGLLGKGIDSTIICAERRNNKIGEYIGPFPATRIERLARKLKLSEDISIKERRNIAKAGGAYECFSIPFSNFKVEEHPAVKKADIVNLHWISNYINFPVFFRSIKKKIVWTLHDMNPFMGGFHYKGDYERNKDNTLLMDIEKRFVAIKSESIRKSVPITICTPSKWLYNESSKSEVLGSYTHHHISYGLDIDIFKRYTKTNCREIFGLPQDKKIMLFLSENISNYRKGFDLLLEALTKSPLSTDYSLLAVGDSGKKYDIPGLLTLESMYEPRLLAMLFSAADVFVLPSREDNLPNVMLEALACGTPVIGFPIGGIKDTIIDGFNGILCKDVSADSLALAIANFFQSNNFVGEDIRNDAIQKFNLGLQAQRYIDIYKNLIGTS